MKTNIIFKEPALETKFWSDKFLHPKTRGLVLATSGFLITEFKDPNIQVRITCIDRIFIEQLEIYKDSIIQGNQLSPSAHFVLKSKGIPSQAVDWTAIPTLTPVQDKKLEEWIGEWWYRRDNKPTLRLEYSTGTAAHKHYQYPESHSGHPELTAVDNLEARAWIKKLEQLRGIKIDEKKIFWWNENA